SVIAVVSVIGVFAAAPLEAQAVIDSATTAQIVRVIIFIIIFILSVFGILTAFLAVLSSIQMSMIKCCSGQIFFHDFISF
ncbi:hypothetical protein, partial [Hungatella sp.]|uniref:hypothetical protein n=1 Tax=Hungatella sp. TaxID=2613924 RepID=UPI002A836440